MTQKLRIFAYKSGIEYCKQMCKVFLWGTAQFCWGGGAQGIEKPCTKTFEQ